MRHYLYRIQIRFLNKRTNNYPIAGIIAIRLVQIHCIMKIEKINLQQKSSNLKAFWQLKSLGKINNHEVQLIKLQGAYEWHTHEEEDKLFFVVDGILELHFRDQIIELHKNECIVVPKGIENKPVAKDEATLMIFEPQR